MPIIEILTLSAPIPSFVVNTAVNEVAVVLPAANSLFVNAMPFAYLIPKDHLVLKSITLRLPYCFTMSTGIGRVSFLWYTFGTGLVRPIFEIGAYGFLSIPEPDQEILLDTKIEWLPSDLTVRAAIQLSTLNLNVSMVGVPASLNGTTQEIQIALKILHNEAMIA